MPIAVKIPGAWGSNASPVAPRFKCGRKPFVADRSQAGTVVDMLYTGWWPTFNVADIAIVCGAFALAATAWRAPPDEPATVP